MTAQSAALAWEAWGTWAGEHALLLYLSLLVLLLAAAGSCWWAVSRTIQRNDPARATPADSQLSGFGTRIALGLIAIVGGAAVFAAVADQVAGPSPLGKADRALTDAVQHSVPPAALHVFAVLTRLADTPSLVVLCVAVGAALVVGGQRLLALAWVAAVAGNSVLNMSLKHVFARVRPLHEDGIVQAVGYSFPSGHSSGSVVAYGMLAYLALQVLPPRWHFGAVLSSVALAFSVGVSRILLRVHFASDVLAGFASGTAWLAVVIASVEAARWHRARMH